MRPRPRSWRRRRASALAAMRLCGYAAMRLCGYAAMRLCGYAAMRLCGYAVGCAVAWGLPLVLALAFSTHRHVAALALS